ncbi:MAG TPA: hypothetical protein VKW06_14480 [Candidatus Angelobacter sp.]|nr:hypothetical protein [Candidatus Angelobacter sp.]
MLRNLPRLILPLVVLGACLATFAKTAKQPSSVTLTGCLSPGNLAERFTLKSGDGKTYALRSSTVDLAGHVGQSVTVKGVLRRDAKRDDFDFEGSEVNEAYGDKILNSTDVEVIGLKVRAAACR